MSKLVYEVSKWTRRLEISGSVSFLTVSYLLRSCSQLPSHLWLTPGLTWKSSSGWAQVIHKKPLPQKIAGWGWNSIRHWASLPSSQTSCLPPSLLITGTLGLSSPSSVLPSPNLALSLGSDPPGSAELFVSFFICSSPPPGPCSTPHRPALACCHTIRQKGHLSPNRCGATGKLCEFRQVAEWSELRLSFSLCVTPGAVLGHL